MNLEWKQVMWKKQKRLQNNCRNIIPTKQLLPLVHCWGAMPCGTLYDQTKWLAILWIRQSPIQELSANVVEKTEAALSQLEFSVVWETDYRKINQHKIIILEKSDSRYFGSRKCMFFSLTFIICAEADILTFNQLFERFVKSVKS